MNIDQFTALKGKQILVTGGAGFIGSNLCEILLHIGAKVRCLDNFATGHRHNIAPFLSNNNFTLLEGDIRDLETCHKACNKADFVLHQAALGSVPRSINDPITSNEVNVSGFLNMLVAARDAGVKRFVYAASSSTYGDHEALPKVENKIGKPLSPYAITKYVNELYAENFYTTYGLNTIGLRYFNVFGRRQDPNGAYAAVIPLFVKQFMNHESPVINGDGTYSRDFTYIDNVLQMNLLALTTERKSALNQVYNTAVGDRTTLLELTSHLKKYLAEYDKKINDVTVTHGPNRKGDIPHSLASVAKAETLLGYTPTHTIEAGIKAAVNWYWTHLK
ncbi:Vi polysaccharide biosynthesis protein VipB/TviC [Mangrovimonas yunxiaonensis]|uniref:Vi polysaccharide biosynthesis protein VipB/TviC n=1 Tax=Mangrovimonas yunxiaonensis TaxID=1197477 RepID=A0A084TLS3_9FLAO|nr:SDR family oxidoreductase [Mangrovimonas yunxiaonensis]KFB01659.1 Vi polysaccharide biosynthesis protein VipB/TviC [Mangrovimonas yunxiaonensis]GGH35385.1 epimerase [Mangrovimonas yunxiaonensis]